MQQSILCLFCRHTDLDIETKDLVKFCLFWSQKCPKIAFDCPKIVPFSYTDLDVKSKNLVDFSEKFKREATNLNIQSLMAFILGVSMIFLVIVIWFKYLCKKTKKDTKT